MKDLKYLLAYLTPLFTYSALYYRGWFSWATVIFAFVLVPALDAMLGVDKINESTSSSSSKALNQVYDLLLYLNVPLLWSIVIYFVHVLTTTPLSTAELVGLVFSVGLAMGAMGINVAHELGHKEEPLKKFLSASLLLPSLYMHFTMEHNLGHHKNIATDSDPASARKGEPLYAFWVRSVSGCYANAWKWQRRILAKKGRPFWSIANQQILFLLIQMSYLTALYLYGGWSLVMVMVAAAIISFLLLESINYIEHYGLRRQLTGNGRYEQVSPIHSWNSDHIMGRIVLYELTRHSDHHYLAYKKYQNLDSHASARQLPYGYPASILLSLIPPLWYRVMDSRI